MLVAHHVPVTLPVALLLPLLLAACNSAKHPALPLVRMHAEKDLACPPDKLEIRPRSGGRYLVKGCGREASYASACEHLECAVGRQGKTPTPWRGPDPGSAEALR